MHCLEGSQEILFLRVIAERMTVKAEQFSDQKGKKQKEKKKGKLERDNHL